MIPKMGSPLSKKIMLHQNVIVVCRFNLKRLRLKGQIPASVPKGFVNFETLDSD
jgi:hypothetical protein